MSDIPLTEYERMALSVIEQARQKGYTGHKRKIFTSAKMKAYSAITRQVEDQKKINDVENLGLF